MSNNKKETIIMMLFGAIFMILFFLSVLTFLLWAGPFVNGLIENIIEVLKSMADDKYALARDLIFRLI